MTHDESGRFDPKTGRTAAGKAGDETVFPLWPRVAGGLVLAIGLVVGCGGWAAFAKLEGAVVTTGSVKVDQNLKEVQHRDGGIVKTLAVRQGDLVKGGQILATLDDVQIKAELLIVRSQLAESLGRKARLIAERDNLSSIVFPDEIKSLTASADPILHGETRLFEGNRVGRESQKEQLELSIVQTGEEIKGMESRLAAKKEEIGLVRAEREKLLMLFEKRDRRFLARLYGSSRLGSHSGRARGDYGQHRARQRTDERDQGSDHRGRPEREHGSPARPPNRRCEDFGVEREEAGNRGSAFANRNQGAGFRLC